MADALASSFIDALLGMELGATTDASNRFSLDGVTFGSSKADGALEIGIRRLGAAAVRLAFGPLVVEVGRVVLNELVGELRTDQGAPRLRFLEAAGAELSGVKIHGPIVFSPELKKQLDALQVQLGDTAAAQAAGSAWCLGPLAAADGRIRAEIVDAHLMFDADVTVPIRRGTIDFNEATVEHVGPDSRMGVGPLGVYVDAANGRSYVYQFSSAPVAGVELEQRGALWVASRGTLRLQAFVEGLLRQAPREPGTGFTEQARLLLDRTALSGDVQLGDGRFAAPGLEADLAGRAEGRNAIRLHSEAVGGGLTVEMPSLSVQHAVLNASAMRLACDALTGALALRVVVEGRQLRFAFDVPEIMISGLRVHPGGAEGV